MLSRESRVREIEKARARQQNGRKLGRGRAYIFVFCHGDMHMGTPVPKTLLIWASPVTLTLTVTQIAKVIWEGDTHITRVWGMGSPKRRVARITVTVPLTSAPSPLSESPEQASKNVRGHSNGRKLKKINILLLRMVNSDRISKKRYFLLRVFIK